MPLEYQSEPLDDRDDNRDMQSSVGRPTEDYVFTHIVFSKSRFVLSKLAAEILRLELRLLNDNRSLIYSTRFHEYWTRAGMCTIIHERPYIIDTIHKRLLSYGYDNILWQDVRDYLDIYLDVIFLKDSHQQNRLSALQFMPKARIKQSLDKKRSKA